MANFRRRSFGPRKVRNLNWAGFTFAATTIAADASVVLGSFVSSGGSDETVVRIRGLILCRSDQLAAPEIPLAAVGMAIVSEDAFTAGIGAGALPRPIQDIGTDHWMMWQAVGAYADSTAGATQLGIFQIDQKGQRIIHSGSRLAVIAQCDSTTGVIIRGAFRALGLLRT